MKTYALAGSIIGSLLTFGLASTLSPSTGSDTQRVISVHHLTLKEGVDRDEAREYLRAEWIQLFEEVPGMNALIGIPSRGEAEGDFAVVYTFDSAFTRDYYYPEEGVYGEPIRKVVEKYQGVYDRLFGTYFLSEEHTYESYDLFARAK